MKSRVRLNHISLFILLVLICNVMPIAAMTGNSVSKTETTASAAGQEANVHVGVNTDGTYTVSVALPQIQGKTTGSQNSTYSGQCTPKEGKNLTLPPTETSVDGNSLTTDGSHRVNPADPNRLSGSYTKTWQNILTTSHSYDWKAYPVGEKPEKGAMNTGGEFLSSGPTSGLE